MAKASAMISSPNPMRRYVRVLEGIVTVLLMI
jgi:hypothetical protein